MRLWTSTCSRPTCSANSLRIGKVATTLTEAAWAVGGWMRGTASAMDSVMARGCSIGRDGSTLPIQSQRRSEEHTSELQSRLHLVCRLLLEKKKKTTSDKSHQ